MIVLKTSVLKNDHFKTTIFKKQTFKNTIIFKNDHFDRFSENENINIPSCSMF